MTNDKFTLIMRYHQYFPELSPRELQVFLLVAQGYKVTDIPNILKEHLNERVSLSTLYNYVERIKNKMDIMDITREASFILINRIIIFGHTPVFYL